MDERINERIMTAEEKPIHPMLMIWEVLRKIWAIILVAAIAASATYVASSALYVPEYQTKTTFVVSVRDGASSVYSNLTAAKSLAGSFSQILDSDVMRKYVAKELGTDRVYGDISATVIEETNLLEMRVTANNPRDAYLITKATLNNYEALAETVLNNIALDILQTPSVPTAPINSSHAEKYAKIAAAAAAALLTVWLCVRVYLRDTVKSIDEVEKKLDAKLLATVYHERKRKSLKEIFDRSKKSILITNPTTGFAFVETYKKLRTRIDYHMRRKNCRTIMVTSVHENEGKSTVAVNLALAMNRNKKSVLLIDADMRKPAIHKILGYKDREYKTITELMTEKAELPQVLIHDRQNNLGLVLGRKGSDRSTEYISSANMKRLIDDAAKNVDLVIIDTPPMAVCADAECLCDMVDAAVIVVRQDQTPAKVINDAIDSISSTRAEFIGCVFNNVRAADFSDNYNYGSGGKYGYGKHGKSKYGYGKYGYGKYGYGHRRSSRNAEKSEESEDEQ